MYFMYFMYFMYLMYLEKYFLISFSTIYTISKIRFPAVQNTLTLFCLLSIVFDAKVPFYQGIINEKKFAEGRNYKVII